MCGYYSVVLVHLGLGVLCQPILEVAISIYISSSSTICMNCGMSVSNAIRQTLHDRLLLGPIIDVRPVEEVSKQDGVRGVEEDGNADGKRVHLASLAFTEGLDGQVI